MNESEEILRLMYPDEDWNFKPFNDEAELERAIGSYVFCRCLYEELREEREEKTRTSFWMRLWARLKA